MVSRNDPYCCSAYLQNDLEIGMQKGTRLPYYLLRCLFYYMTASKYQDQNLYAVLFRNKSLYKTSFCRI